MIREKWQKTRVNKRDEKTKVPLPLTHWTLGYIYDNCIPLQKWQNKSARGAVYDRKRMAHRTWFKWQVIEQQTHIKTVLMSSVFHLGSIRWLVEADANTEGRGCRDERVLSCFTIEWSRCCDLWWNIQAEEQQSDMLGCRVWCTSLFLVSLSLIFL